MPDNLWPHQQTCAQARSQGGAIAPQSKRWNKFFQVNQAFDL